MTLAPGPNYRRVKSESLGASGTEALAYDFPSLGKYGVRWQDDDTLRGRSSIEGQ